MDEYTQHRLTMEDHDAQTSQRNETSSDFLDSPVTNMVHELRMTSMARPLVRAFLLPQTTFTGEGLSRKR